MQQAALKAISESLVEDPLVQAVFVKGSIARGEEDEFSDIDLYCLVKEEDKGDFLNKRIGHIWRSIGRFSSMRTSSLSPLKS